MRPCLLPYITHLTCPISLHLIERKVELGMKEVILITCFLVVVVICAEGFRLTVRQPKLAKSSQRGLLTSRFGIMPRISGRNRFALSMSTPQGDPQNPMVRKIAWLFRVQTFVALRTRVTSLSVSLRLHVGCSRSSPNACYYVIPVLTEIPPLLLKRTRTPTQRRRTIPLPNFRSSQTSTLRSMWRPHWF